MKITLLLGLLLPGLISFSQADYTQYADPMVGTGGHGSTFPGATMPFGMVQLSPDTRLSAITGDGCSGYVYSDSIIYGFSHTHLSGTGCSDYGDVLLMPLTGRPVFGSKKYSSHFSHSNEKASPGYYSVILDKHHIRAELTVTERTGLHKYTFPKSGQADIILDLVHRDWVKKSEITFSVDNEISGSRLSAAWADNQYIYFVVRFSKPFKHFGINKGGVLSQNRRHAKGRLLKAYVSFETNDGEVVYAKVGISAVSVEGARRNLDTGQPEWDFDKVAEQARSTWNKELGKIEFSSKDMNVMRTFYSSLYHAMTPPNLYQDVDGKYRGRDLKIHEAKDFNYYTVFSTWDTYRALHPLLTLIDRKRTSDFINTFLTQYEQGDFLPVWELSACETHCMIGYHAVSIINDAFQKGIAGFDAAKALEAMKHSATTTKHELDKHKKFGSVIEIVSQYRYAVGWDDYQKYGYIRYKSGRESVSKTLEFSYDDWCIAQMARKLGMTADYNYFIKRAQNYRYVLDTVTGFMRARQKDFIHHFDPYEVSHKYTESNAWQYSFYVPQDLSGQMRLLGGRHRLATMLDSLFATSSVLRGHKEPAIAGLIGQYAHGNEPSHQIAYEYDYVGQPWQTQKMVRLIMDSLYRDKPDGLSGNEDCGQMSAWYIFSALGFYPVCPGSSDYAIGSPLCEKAVIHFENGKSFTIRTINNLKGNVYIQSAQLNGLNYTKSYITYDDIVNGGELEFEMGPQPNKNWGSSDKDVPVSNIE
jgi:predicted alpha-1,2-mannosidase